MTLAELISEQLMAKQLTLRAAAARSHGLVSSTALHAYAKGVTAARPSPRTLHGLSLALDVPVEKVAAAAGSSAPRPFTLPERAQLLTERERRAVLAVVDAFLAGHGDGAG